MTNYTIPKPNAPFSDGGTPPRREWYNFLRGLYDLYESSDATVQAQITALCYKLGSPDGTIANIPDNVGGVQSVTGYSSILANGTTDVTLRLAGDILNAQPLTFYGALVENGKGWQPFSTNFQITTTSFVDYLDLVDLVDSGTGTFKLLVRDTKGRLSGTKDGAASDVPVTNTGWTILTGSNVQTALDSADANFTHVVSTGVHYGMQITINGTNPSAVDISAGNGDILNNTVPSAPTYTTVNFAGQTGIAVINTTAPITYWSIDSAGVVHQSIVAPTPDEYRTSIQLGSTMYNGGVITQVAHNIPSAQQAIAQIGDLYEALGFVNYGLYPYANGANLNFNVTAGRIASYGANFFVDPLDPNFVSYAAKIPVTFRYGTQSTQSATDVTTVDVANYDVGGVVTPIPGSSSRATIQTVWQLTSGSIRVQYGEQYYNNINEALANIATRAFIPNPTYAAEGGIIGAIVVEKSATDLSNTAQAIFVKANKFGEFASGSGSSTSVISFNGRSGIVLPVSGDYTTDLVTEATNLYFTQSRVLATPLTGLSTATATPITATDTVLSAAGKLQAQVTARLVAANNLSDLTSAPTARTNLGLGTAATYTVGNNAPGFIPVLDGVSGQTTLSLYGSTSRANILLSTAQADGPGVPSGTLTFLGGPSASIAETRICLFSVSSDGTTATNRGGKFAVALKLDGASTILSRMSINNTGIVEPGVDNTQSMGSAALRWSVIYAGTGTINTSDAREKTAVSSLTDAEIAASCDMAKAIGTYQWLSSVAEKGSSARLHIGMTVQQAISIMQSHGLDPFRYGFICYDNWEETPEVIDKETGDVTQPYRAAGDRYSFRTDELNLFLARGFDARLTALEAK